MLVTTIKPIRVSHLNKIKHVTAHRAVRCYSSSPSEEDLIVIMAYKEVQASCFDDLDEAACAVAWDNVDEVYRGLAQRREKKETDPLEIYCSALPEGDECREYDV